MDLMDIDKVLNDLENAEIENEQSTRPKLEIGKTKPFWVPDNETTICMRCELKFSFTRRRHHCRGCGKVLCSTCCSFRSKLEYTQSSIEHRVCGNCWNFLKPSLNEEKKISPNPNNPMEYCSTLSPYQQVEIENNAKTQMEVMVPVSVLKKQHNIESQKNFKKKVTFSDGISPGKQSNFLFKIPQICSYNCSLDYDIISVDNDINLIKRLQEEHLRFFINKNFFVKAKIVKLACCVNETILNLSTEGLHDVGQDEITILLKFDIAECKIPVEIFQHFTEIYENALAGSFIPELGYSLANQSPFLGSSEHGGFLYIRQSFQCIQDIIVPEAPFLIGILIHKQEIPWAKIFPLRLTLRLGAEYRYYPCPHVSIRERPTVYMDIAHTIINFLADFRNYSYSLNHIKGLVIHMEDRKTSVLIPKNRYDSIMKALCDSTDNILSLGGDFSSAADGHLVCIQNLRSDTDELLNYSTQAINIQGQPRKITGANFIVFNGALKSSAGFSAKCCIVEDGLMVQISAEKLLELRKSLENKMDFEIFCGTTNSEEIQKEIVNINWVQDDCKFNIGVVSPIDGMKFDGIPSIRINKINFQKLSLTNQSVTIRCTEVFILSQNSDEVLRIEEINILDLTDKIAVSTISALQNFLDLLLAKGCLKIGLRTSLSKDLVSYEAGSKVKFPPLYMNSLDNELVPVLHKEANNIQGTLVIELIFKIIKL